jgi:hypothetical protein
MNKRNESKLNSGRNEEQIEVTESLLSFSPESSVFQFAIHSIRKYYDTQNDNIAC